MASRFRLSCITSIVWAVLGATVSIAEAQQPAAKQQVTFTKDIAPILQRSCQACHRPGSMAPMSLLTYEEARPWARSMKAKVTARDMPPWFIDKHVGIRKFKDDPSLSDEEIAKVSAWVDAGAPNGNPADLPAPRQFGNTDAWHIGEPDLIVSLPKDLPIPATGADQWRDVVVDTGLTEDRYIKAVETRPTKAFNAVHHVVTTMDGFAQRGGDFLMTFLNEYSIGKGGDVMPDGVGRLIKAGTKLTFNMHTYSVGEDLQANVAVGLKFYPKGYVPKHPMETAMVGKVVDLDIPANTDNVRVDGYYQLTRPTRLLSVQPHMHSRGSAMCVEAIYPGTNVLRGDMRTETLSCIDRFQFGWAIDYHYQDDVQPLLPAGTILHVTGWHNNTKGNRFNSDSDNLITWGPRTIDDMSFAWMNWISLSDQEFAEQVKERQAKPTN